MAHICRSTGINVSQDKGPLFGSNLEYGILGCILGPPISKNSQAEVVRLKNH